MTNEEFVAVFYAFSRMMFECMVTVIVLSITWFVITGRISFEGMVLTPVFALCWIAVRHARKRSLKINFRPSGLLQDFPLL